MSFSLVRASFPGSVFSVSSLLLGRSSCDWMPEYIGAAVCHSVDLFHLRVLMSICPCRTYKRMSVHMRVYDRHILSSVCDICCLPYLVSHIFIFVPSCRRTVCGTVPPSVRPPARLPICRPVRSVARSLVPQLSTVDALPTFEQLFGW